MLLKVIDKLMGTPALQGAVLSNDRDEVQRLLDSGANVNLQDKRHNNATALIAAASSGYVDIARLLIDRGCHFELKCFTVETALLVAARRGNYDLVRLLVDAGANVNAQDKMNWSALIWTASKGCRDTVDFLISKGAFIDAKTKDYGGLTALMQAVSNGHFDVVSELVEAGANVNLRRSDGMDALMIALANNQFEITQLLENRQEKSFAVKELSYLEFKKILLSLYDDLKIFNQQRTFISEKLEEKASGKKYSFFAHIKNMREFKRCEKVRIKMGTQLNVAYHMSW